MPKYMNFYGPTYVIFPVNGFEVIWSPDIMDLYELTDLSYNIHIDYKDNNKYEWAITKEDLESEDRSGVVVSLEYTISNFRKGCVIAKKFLKWREWKINQIVDTYKISKNKLPKFNKKTEIMLVCDKYYAISVEHAYSSESTILKELGIK